MPGPIPHGTVRGYNKFGCRDDCPAPITCRMARALYQHDLSRRKQAWDYVDEVAVERACSGDRSVPLTPYEMLAAFRELDRRGYSAGQIAARLGVTKRSVVRWRNGAVTRPQGRAAA